MTAPDYAARAAAGAEFLDAVVPGWAERVELATLDLSSEDDCVLGQLGQNYQDTRDDFHLSRDAAADLGFTLRLGEPWDDWAELDGAWTREVFTRREAAEVAVPSSAPSPAGPAGGSA